MTRARALRAAAVAVLVAAAAPSSTRAQTAPPAVPSAPPAGQGEWWREATRLQADAAARTQAKDFDAALALLEKALALAEAAKSDDYVLVTLRMMIAPLAGKRDPARAEATLQRLVDLSERKHGRESPFTAMALNDFADFYRQVGELSRAEPMFERAIAIYEAAPEGPARLGAAAPLNNLANLHVARGRYDKALELLERALALQEKAAGKDHPIVANTLSNLAIVAHRKGDLEKALALGQRSCAMLEKAMPGDYSLAQCWSNLGAVLQSKGDLAGARALLDRSMAARRLILGDRHPRVAESRNMLAQLLEASGDAPGALAELDAADALVDEDLEHILRAGSEGQKKDFMAKLAGQTEGTISLQMGAARGVPGAARLALRTVLRRKGKVLDAVASGSAALRRSMGEADRGLFDQLSSARQKLAELVLGGPKGGGPAHQAAVLAAEKKVDALEAEVSKRSAAFRAASRPVTLEAVAKAIPKGAALVEIARYRPFNVRWRSGAEAWRPARYVAYLLGPAGDPTAVDLGEAAPIEELAAKLRKALADPAGPDPKPIARDLDDRVLAPVIKALGAGTSTVLLSPDGVLNLVPWGALVDEAGRYRVEATTFTYLTSGRDLLRMDAGLAPRGKAMVIANPSFGEAPARTEGTSRLAVNMRFSPLPGTEEEGAAIARLLPGARLATGAEASEGALKRAEAPAILHVATHGFFLGDPAGSSGERGSDLDGQSAASGGGAAPKGALVPLGLPLLRSGLAFASANRRADGADDGLLTALEAAGLDLWGTELVVLSACETGVGDATSGEGVYGLRRALVMAGAQSEVISLWKVDDAATRDLMVGYYRRLVAGGGRTAALRETQLELLASADRRHPFYWAAFIPSGAWGPLTLESLPPSPAATSAPPPSPPPVPPGARGCGCDVAPSSGSRQALLLVALALAIRRWRERSR